MDAFVDRLTAPLLADWGSRALLSAAVREFYTFTLVLVRLSGLMVIGPMFGQSLVPANVRVFLVFVLALLVTPTLSLHYRAGFDRLDADADGTLTRDEVPTDLQPRFDRQLELTGRRTEDSLTPRTYAAAPPPPNSVFEYAYVIAGEFALGLLLGVGVLILFSGLQLAGEIFDQQTGLALGEIANPGFDITGSITGQTLFLLGMTVFLVMTPVGGHLQMLDALIETFQTLPVGQAFVNYSSVMLLRDLVHQSLVLGVQVAAPLLAVASLMALTMGFLGHTVPQINILVVGFPIRAMVNLLILTITLSGAGRAVVDLVPVVIDQLRASLGGFS